MSTPWARTMSTARCSIVSMPRPSRSNFTSPAAAQSSLSHWSTERPSMRAHSIGQNSTSGRSAITMPPEWMPRWRGKSITALASSSASGGIAGGRVVASGPSSGTPSRVRSRCVRSNRRSLRGVTWRWSFELLVGQLAERFGARGPTVDPLAERVGLTGRDARGLRHLAQRGTRPVRDHVRHLRGAVASVAFVDVLDHLFAPLVLDVEVDVGRSVALGRQEPFEQQPERDRVGLGDTERVTDRAVRRAPPPLAVDVGAAAELDDVVQQQEVAGEAELLDHAQLVRRSVASPARVADGSPGRRPPRPGARARATTTSRRDPSGTGESGSCGAASFRSNAHSRAMSTVRSTAPGQRANRRSCSAGAAQVRERRGRQPAVDLVERTAGAHRGERLRERTAGRAWRSARCSSRPLRPRRASRPARARRCGAGRADRRDPTARRAHGRARTRRPARGARARPRPGRRGRARPAPCPCDNR